MHRTGADWEAGSLLVLPELFATGFSMNPQRVGEEEQGPTEEFLAELAVQYRSTVLGGVCRKLVQGKGGNEAVAFGPDGTRLCRYRKIHSFSPAGETEAYEAGNSVVTFPWNGFKVAPLICYDLRFPEVFRAASTQGADFLIVISSWPERRQHHMTVLLQARAIENQAYVLGVNRTGEDPHFTYQGGSVLFGPQGEILAEAGSAEGFLTAEVSPTLPAQWRKDFPALRDRRTDLFQA